jgi:adenosylcobinamide-GDP ribazoletransferase
MNNFLSAIQFMTILPVGRHGSFEPRGMVPYFPLVGLLLGILVYALDAVALRLWSRPVAAVLDVLWLAVVTGALHLDGLGDTADGLFGHHPREKALAIMKDSRVGAMGVVAIVLNLMLKWTGIAELDLHRGLVLVLVPAYARAGLLFGFRFLDYGRPGGGTAKPFFADKPSASALWGILVPVVLSIALGLKAIALNAAFAVVVGAILLFYKKRLGCITGDMFGAMTEATESALFLISAVGGLSC